MLKANSETIDRIFSIIRELVTEDNGEELDAFIRAIDNLHSWGLVEDEVCRQIDVLCDEILLELDACGGVLQ